MDYSELKKLMKVYLGSEADSKELEHLFVHDPTVAYSYGEYIYIGLSHLQKCVMLTNKYPKLNDYLEKYLENYNNVDQVITGYGNSALHLASRHSRNFSTERTVEILINAGANVNLQNSSGWTALHYASQNSRNFSTERTVEILILADADVNLQDNYGWTALHFASLYSRNLSTEKTVEILINAGADVNLQDNYGRSALHLALRYLNSSSAERMVEILILADADVFSLKDIHNKTPYDYLPQDLKERFQIDFATQTIGIKTGRLTKCAKK